MRSTPGIKTHTDINSQKRDENENEKDPLESDTADMKDRFMLSRRLLKALPSVVLQMSHLLNTTLKRRKRF